MNEYKAFAARTITCDGQFAARGFRLRSYSVNMDGVQAAGVPSFDEGIRLALQGLPSELADGCPGVGFLIKHHGPTANYVVLAWWSQENELPTRVFVTDPQTRTWRAARNESFCVWDLEVFWRERNHYIRTMLNGNSSISDYIEKVP